MLFFYYDSVHKIEFQQYIFYFYEVPNLENFVPMNNYDPKEIF